MPVRGLKPGLFSEVFLPNNPRPNTDFLLSIAKDGESVEGFLGKIGPAGRGRGAENPRASNAESTYYYPFPFSYL